LASNNLIRFEGYEIDPAARSLRRDGQPIPLNPKTLDLLLYLVQHPQSLVSKDELIDAVWPDSIVEETNLTQHVFLLRKALANHLVATVPGKGYQFTAAVTHVSPDPATSPEGVLVMHAVQSITRVMVEEREDDDPIAAVPIAPAKPRLSQSPARRKRIWWAAATAALVLFLAGAAWLAYTRLRPPSRDHVQVVIADFENSTGDTTFDHTLNRVVQIDLQQSPYFTVVGEGRVRQALTLMGRKPGDPITGADVHEVCQRLNAQVYLTPSIASLGSRYLAAMSANSCVNSSVVGARKQDSDSKAGVLRAVEELTSRIRKDVGESRASLQQFDKPLYQERTSSLEALKAYSEAERQFNSGKMDDAIRLFEHAVELDPNFAVALADLSSAYYNMGDTQRDKQNISRAWAMLDTVNERERLYITYRYHQSVTGDLHSMRDTLQLWSATYPRDNLVLANLANHLTWIGQYKESADAAVRSLQVNAAIGAPINGVALEIAARAFKHLGQYDKALEYFNTAVQHKIDSGPLHGIALQIAALRHDDKEVARQVAWSRGTADESTVLQQAAMAALADGRVHDSDALFAQATSAARRDKVEAGLDTIDAYRPRILIDMGLIPQAKALIAAYKGEDPSTDELYAEAETGDQARSRAAAQRRQKDAPQDTLVNTEYAPSVYAALALRAGKPAEAVELMRAAEPYELRDPCIAYLRGQAFLAAKMLPEAAAEFRKLIDNPGIDDPLTPLHALAHLNLARILVLQRKPSEARAEYARFFDMWSHADPDLPPVRQARSEMQRLPAQP
jgi:DNA-binding winged helix-turn-helix (wHTH) protein/tetratricopeptide (TPR) repeat protein